MIHFLLEHGADPGLAEEQPLLLTAARCCGPEVVSLFAGQAAKLSPKQKERAFQEVRWGKRTENIQVLEQAGITVEMLSVSLPMSRWLRFWSDSAKQHSDSLCISVFSMRMMAA